MKKEMKEAFVSAMSQKLAESQVVFLTDYRGLTAEQMNQMRLGFRNAGVEYRVVKNNLLKLAAEGTDLSPIIEDLVGPTGLVIAESDPVEASKVIVDFSKDHPVFEYKTGLLRGNRITFDQIEAMAKLPARDVLVGKLLGTMNAVPSGLVNVMAGVTRKFMYALAAVRDAKENG